MQYGILIAFISCYLLLDIIFNLEFSFTFFNETHLSLNLLIIEMVLDQILKEL